MTSQFILKVRGRGETDPRIEKAIKCYELLSEEEKANVRNIAQFFQGVIDNMGIQSAFWLTAVMMDALRESAEEHGMSLREAAKAHIEGAR